jgi:hypothetical protein
MYRRALLKLMGAFGGLLLYGSAFSTRRGNGQLGVTFLVAGVRFHTALSDVAVGDPVTILAATYQGSRCYEVLLGRSRIGYVPRDTIGRLPDRPSMTGVVSAVNINALPWKRFEVTMSV